MMLLASAGCGRLATVPPPLPPGETRRPTEPEASERARKALLASDAVRAEAGSADATAGVGGVSSAETAAYSAGASRRRTGEQATNVKASTHDDNEEYPAWVKFTARRWALPMVLMADYSDRVTLRIVDSNGAPVMNERFAVVSGDGRALWEGVTYANGESVLFPRLFWGDTGRPSTLSIGSGSGETVMVPWRSSLEGFFTATLSAPRVVPQKVPVDVAFVLDATGSMGDEIQQLRDAIYSIHSRLQNASREADIRFGMVIYRDRGDAEPLRVVPFTADVDSFQLALESVQATGGGDTPEDIQNGLYATLKHLVWRKNGIRNAFLIADAPPHTDYGQNLDYLWAGRTANSLGIRLHMVGASGLDVSGEHIFRQIAVTTYAQFIFLTYGESGESSGHGTVDDPGRVSHHTGGNWAARRLDDIVVDLVRRDIAYQKPVPMLTSDNPTPADQRDHLILRMDNLWQQMTSQLEGYSADTLTAVVLPFEDALDDSMQLADYLRDISIEALLKFGRVRVVERERLAQILAEQSLSTSGAVDPATAVELGNLLNTRIVLFGKVYRLGTDRVVHVRAVDTETAQVVAAARVRV
jgi:TolB-like protein